MKILWLCSWYPNSKDLFDGDFIERHAASLALYQPVDVIHFVQNTHLLGQYEFQQEQTVKGGVTSFAYSVSYPKIWIRPLRSLVFNRRYLYLLKKTIRNYIKQNGRPDLIHLHVPVKMGAAALWMKQKWEIPFVVTEHSSSYFDFIPESYASRNRYFRYITRKSFEEAVVVSSVSQWLLKRLNELFVIRKTILIRNAVDTGLFFPIEKQNTVTRFLHVSMMAPLKNAAGILAAFIKLNEQITDWELVFAGPVQEHLKQQAISAGLAHKIKWTGVLMYEQVAQEMQQADALVHFSNYENLPCVVNEALCCGLPVISSNVGGIAELVNESNGILVEPGNIPGLVNAINAFIDAREKFSKSEIAANANKLFSYKVIGRELMDLYQSVLQKN